MTIRVFNTTRLTAGKDGIITGMLLPYGEPGLTNKGRVTAARGVLAVPDVVPLNSEHNRRVPIGKLKLRDTSAGIIASPMLVATKAGQDAATEIENGLRASLSIEIDNPIIRAGKLKGGKITGAALVAEPAFTSAVLKASLPDEGELDEATAELDEVVQALDEAAAQIEDIAEVTDPDEPKTTTDEEEEPPMVAARMRAGAPHAKSRKITHDKDWLIANLVGQSRDQRMLAALADVVPGDILGVEQPAYVGELWNGKAYERRFIPMFNHATLDSFKVQGWRWKTRPEVEPWAGNKTAVPSNEIETEPVEIEAWRIAGAHDIDRKFRDFGSEEFWNAYFTAMTESYAKKSDSQVLSLVKAAAPVLTAKPGTTGIAQGLVNVVDGAIAILNETETMPTGAVVSLDLWRDILLTPQDDVLGYLSAAVNLESGDLASFQIVPSSTLNAGETLVATKPAVTVHELGETPIRVEALDVARGGIDSGVFGYAAVNIHDAGGLALITPETTPPETTPEP